METKSKISLMFLLQAIINGVNLAIAEKPKPDQQVYKCSKGDISPEKLKNRDDALNSLYKLFDNPRRSYVGYETGDSTDVWAKGLCPPTMKREDCRDCISNTISHLKQNCPKQKEGVVWTSLTYHYCMVHYIVDSSSPTIRDWASFAHPPLQPPANVGELEKGVDNLANKLKEIAVIGTMFTKYGAGSIKYGPGGSKTLYGSMQCLPFISKVECRQCLSDATNEVQKCCGKLSKPIGTVFTTKCNFGYTQFK